MCLSPHTTLHTHRHSHFSYLTCSPLFASRSSSLLSSSRSFSLLSSSLRVQTETNRNNLFTCSLQPEVIPSSTSDKRITLSFPLIRALPTVGLLDSIINVVKSVSLCSHVLPMVPLREGGRKGGEREEEGGRKDRWNLY